MLINECIVAQSEVIRAIVLDRSPCCMIRAIDPCICMVLWQINSACGAGGPHGREAPVRGRHVAGAVVL